MREDERKEIEEMGDEPLGKLVKRMQNEVMDPRKLYPGIGVEGQRYYWKKYEPFQLLMEAFDLGYKSAISGRYIDQIEGAMANDWIDEIEKEMEEMGLYNRREKEA
jgi:hypothetical protein